MRKLVGLGVLAVMAVACVDELAEGAGEMLVDAGQVLADAGAALTDAGNDSAAAQANADAGQIAVKPETLELPCDHAYKTVSVSRQLRGEQGMVEQSRTTQISYYAEIDGTASGVDAWACGWQSSVQPLGSCADKSLASCTESADVRAPTLCAQINAELVEGKIRVSCGFESRTVLAPVDGKTYPDQVMMGRWTTARVTIRR